MISEIIDEDIKDFSKLITQQLFSLRKKTQAIYTRHEDFFGELVVKEGSYVGLPNMLEELYACRKTEEVNVANLPLLIEIDENFANGFGHVKIKKETTCFQCYVVVDEKFASFEKQDISISYSDDPDNMMITEGLVLDMKLDLLSKKKALQGLKEIDMMLNEVDVFYKDLKNLLENRDASEFMNKYQHHFDLINLIYLMSEVSIKESIISAMTDKKSISVKGLKNTIDSIREEDEEEDYSFMTDSITYFLKDLNVELKENVGWALLTERLLMKYDLNKELKADSSQTITKRKI